MQYFEHKDDHKHLKYINSGCRNIYFINLVVKNVLDSPKYIITTAYSDISLKTKTNKIQNPNKQTKNLKNNNNHNRKPNKTKKTKQKNKQSKQNTKNKPKTITNKQTNKNKTKPTEKKKDYFSPF